MQGRALVIEENPYFLLSTRTVLERCRFCVSDAVTAVAALEAIESQTFDLVTLSISLPGDMNGVELARALLRRVPDLPIILMAGQDERLPRGVGDFIVVSKPPERRAVRTALIALMMAD